MPLLTSPNVQFHMGQHFAWFTSCCSESDCSLCPFNERLQSLPQHRIYSQCGSKKRIKLKSTCSDVSVVVADGDVVPPARDSSWSTPGVPQSKVRASTRCPTPWRPTLRDYLINRVPMDGISFNYLYLVYITLTLVSTWHFSTYYSIASSSS